jgi:prevent-host-death family protein
MVKEHNQVIITNKGKGEAVLIKIEDYAGYEEYLHQRYILEKLAESERIAAMPGAKRYSWEEVMEEFNEGL